MNDKIVKVPKKKYRFHVMRELAAIENLCDGLPCDDVYKFISNGGFSSIAFIKFIADRTVINRMTATTLRVGKKHLLVLDELHKRGRLKYAKLVVGTIMENDSKYVMKYQYFDNLKKTCDRNGWEVISCNNHSKLLLFDTDAGKFVVETSSNLNENPSIEQFSFEKSDALYDFYNSIEY